jgi:hypothetical protein
MATKLSHINLVFHFVGGSLAAAQPADSTLIAPGVVVLWTGLSLNAGSSAADAIGAIVSDTQFEVDATGGTVLLPTGVPANATILGNWFNIIDGVSKTSAMDRFFFQGLNGNRVTTEIKGSGADGWVRVVLFTLYDE